ncbi:MAG TPA: hypothetical protein VFV31_03105 [Chitinophagaceae bacterium]|nr:hypothetical protein [Chitinophagaceae bacterium]
MTREGHNKLRKVIAAIFIAALVFIYAEKAIHRHLYIPADPVHTAYSINYNYSTCSLCDFQPVTTAEIPQINECSLPVILIEKDFSVAEDHYFFQTLPLAQQRGPPSRKA